MITESQLEILRDMLHECDTAWLLLHTTVKRVPVEKQSPTVVITIEDCNEQDYNALKV